MGIGADKEVLRRCKEAIAAVDSSAEIFLFGSRARGEAEDDSDYDLLILIDGEAGLSRDAAFVSALLPVELETGAVVSFILYSKTAWNQPLYRAMPLHREISREGYRV